MTPAELATTPRALIDAVDAVLDAVDDRGHVTSPSAIRNLRATREAFARVETTEEVIHACSTREEAEAYAQRIQADTGRRTRVHRQSSGMRHLVLMETTDVSPLKPREFVEWIGAGRSALDYGRGKVVSVGPDTARVEVLTGGDVMGNQIRAGERLYFGLDGLRRVSALARNPHGQEAI